MFKKAEKQDKDQIIEYIGNDYNKCLYLYLDLVKYGFDNKAIKVWIDVENDAIICVVLKYYSGMHVFSKNKNCNYESIKKIIIEENPSIICAEKFLIENLVNMLNEYDYSEEYGWVRVFSKHYNCDNSCVELATEKDFEEISQLIINDPMGEFYELEELISQIKERYNDNFGRHFILKQDNKIISHASTTAEIGDIAVLSNVITIPQYRGKGLATIVCSKLCNDLLNEGKNVYLINYTDESTRLYDKLGFEISCEIGKLFKKS